MTGVVDILDQTLDDLADLPEFKPYPEGAHKARIKFEQKVVNSKPSVELKLSGIETVELAHPDKDQPIEIGQETNVLYVLTTDKGEANSIGQGKLKEVLVSLKDTVGGNTSREIMENAKDLEVLVVTKQRENKSTGKFNTDIVSIGVV